MIENKPMMIDGVNVSKCIHRLDTICTADCLYYCGKDDMKDCYFKRLARKAQECETLSSQLDFEVLKKECLEQECEKLKREIEEQILRYAKLDADFDQLKTENEKLKNEIEACYNQVEDFDIIATSKSNKLKQAEQKLEKIQEYCNKYAQNSIGFKKNILQIIDEVE